MAVATPEASRQDLEKLCERLRRAHGGHSGEVKLPQLGETGYKRFLDELADIDMAFFATATDSGLNAPVLVEAHRAAQVADIRSNIPRMRFEGGRIGLSLLADQVESLPNQLYVQLICQVNLLDDVMRRGINYYVQRHPATLREFRWRVDQKNTTKTTFEEAFEKIAPPLLQSRSIREPLFRVKGFDYRYFAAYEFAEGEAPDYLQTEYGLPPMDGFNVQKLLRGNLRFVDSNSLAGVQVADLLASGLRRTLKGAFDDPYAVAERIGRLAVQNMRGRESINLVSLGHEETVDKQTSTAVKAITRNSQAFIHAKYRSAV